MPFLRECRFPAMMTLLVYSFEKKAGRLVGDALLDAAFLLPNNIQIFVISQPEKVNRLT
jgi:hypothetical protein